MLCFFFFPVNNINNPILYPSIPSKKKVSINIGKLFKRVDKLFQNNVYNLIWLFFIKHLNLIIKLSTQKVRHNKKQNKTHTQRQTKIGQFCEENYRWSRPEYKLELFLIEGANRSAISKDIRNTWKTFGAKLYLFIYLFDCAHCMWNSWARNWTHTTAVTQAAELTSDL